MVEALDAERCEAIAAEIMEKPAEKIREENQHVKEKVVTISINFFSKTGVTNSTTKSMFLKLPVNRFFNMLEDSIKRDTASISEKIQKESSFEKIESLVTITVAGTEVFRENKTFDQLGLTVQAS